jgi:UDP-N-acetylmuramate--alanine ligase
MKIHFIGIGGFGMNGLAEYLHRQGNVVTGSDLNKSELTGRLEKLGISIYLSHSEQNISAGTELVVYSSAVKNDNPELVEALKRNIPVLKRSEMLARIVNDSYLISVSGTHGKTTTSAMISYILIEAGMDPDVFTGGALEFLSYGTSRSGSGKISVVEADEYDRSFLTLKSDVAIINNIDSDHLDIYSDINDIKDNFRIFINNCKVNHVVIANGDDNDVSDVISGLKTKTKLFGVSERNHYKILNPVYSSGSEYKIKFDLKTDKQIIKDIQLKIPGLHNAMNATAAYIVCEMLNIPTGKFREIISNFTGVQRRLELKYEGTVKIYDDYAHHPTEIKSSFDAVKNISTGRIITVFQPHLYSRTKDFYREFAHSLSGNDITILTDIYPAREKSIEGVTSELIFNELKKVAKGEIYLVSRNKISDFLNEKISDNDTVIFQGAGDITNICREFTDILKSKNTEN